MKMPSCLTVHYRYVTSKQQVREEKNTREVMTNRMMMTVLWWWWQQEYISLGCLEVSSQKDFSLKRNTLFMHVFYFSFWKEFSLLLWTPAAPVVTQVLWLLVLRFSLNVLTSFLLSFCWWNKWNKKKLRKWRSSSPLAFHLWRKV